MNRQLCTTLYMVTTMKGFLNFLVTYEKDLFTGLAYEKVIDL